MIREVTTKVPSQRAARSGQDLNTLIRKVPTDLFIRMVSKAGLPPDEARELCLVFKELKA